MCLTFSHSCVYLEHRLLWLPQKTFDELSFPVSVQDDNPPLSVVRKFVHLLDASDNDYAEELGRLIAIT